MNLSTGRQAAARTPLEFANLNGTNGSQEGVTSQRTGDVTRTYTTIDAYRGTTSATPTPTMHPTGRRRTPQAHIEMPSETTRRRTVSALRLEEAKEVPQRSPPTPRTDTSACNQNRRRARRNHRGRHYLRRDFRIERLPADRRPAAPYPDRHIDPLLPPRQVQELTRRTPRSSAWRHARPERRLRTQRRCPRAITAMAIPTFGLSNLLTGGTT